MRVCRLMVLAGLLAASTGRAQTTQTVVRMRAVDSLGNPVANAQVAVMRGLSTTLATGTTAMDGSQRLNVPRGDDELQIVVRRIGYRVGSQFFRANRDTLGFTIELRELPRELPTVKVTAAEDLKRKHDHLDADDIANSSRSLVDGLDVVTKLRPEMMDPGPGIFSRCPLRHIFINGVIVVNPPINYGVAKKALQTRHVVSQLKHTPASGIATADIGVQSVLANLHAEHIAEVNYVDCTNTSVPGSRAQGSLFITLKPGVAFDEVSGSYVADDGLPQPGERASEPAAASSETKPASSAYHQRLLGVFDQATGDPLSGARVTDSSGTFALTSATGTVTLAFLPEGRSTIKVTKPGYAPVSLDVDISPRDTTPITLVLTRP